MTWFEELTGCAEESPAQVRQDLAVDGHRLRSHKNGRAWRYGALETPTLAELRDRVRDVSREPKPLTVREVVADVQALHADEGHANALFQVASQFNLLEMVSPTVTPERGSRCRPEMPQDPHPDLTGQGHKVLTRQAHPGQPPAWCTAAVGPFCLRLASPTYHEEPPGLRPFAGGPPGFAG